MEILKGKIIIFSEAHYSLRLAAVYKNIFRQRIAH
jgi:hypothetical protein